VASRLSLTTSSDRVCHPMLLLLLLLLLLLA